MITRSSLKRDIEVIRSLVARLADYTEQHNEIHTDLDTYLDQLDTKIRELEVELNKLFTSYSREVCDVNLQLDKLWNFVQNLDGVEHDLDSKIYQLESKIEFLDENKDAINMWIECVRQTQQLYADSQKAKVIE